MRFRSAVRVTAVAGLLAMVASGCTWVSRASVDSSGGQADGFDSGDAAISSDGRYVAFGSAASNLVVGDTNAGSDVFVRDTVAGTTTRVSLDSSGGETGGGSDPAISGGGRYVAFESFASDLVAGDTNTAADVFVRDTVAGTTTRVSVDSSGGQGNNQSFSPAISADGRYVAFTSHASNLVAGDTNNGPDVFVRDTVAGTTTRVNLGGSGGQANFDSGEPAISGDGRYVAFYSAASNLVAGDTNSAVDVFVRDTVAGTTTRISVDGSGGEADGMSNYPVLSGDGRYVAFTSDASNLVAGDTNTSGDVFVRDTVAGTTTRINVDSSGGQTGGGFDPTISGDGRYVAFDTDASNLVAGDTNGSWDVFVRDTLAGTTTRVSLDTFGSQADADSFTPALSADGRYVAFGSGASNLVGGDTNDVWDVFVRANPTVTVSGIAPGTAPRGVATAVTIAGTNLRSGVTVDAGGDVAVSNVVVVDESTVTATFTPSPTASTGARNVSVTLPGTGPGAGTGTTGLCLSCLTIT